MSHEVETMAYRMRGRTDVPWHNLGKPITSDADAETMIVEAGLDWTVSKRPLWTPTADGSGNLEVKDYFSLIRTSDSRILGICGKEYIPTQNRQAFSFFKKFCDAGQMTMETAGSLQGGRQVWVLAKIEKLLELPGGDQIWGYLLMSSPHVWGKSLVIKFVTIRVVCANTLAMAMSESGRSFRMPHVKEFDEVAMSEAHNALGIAESMLDAFGAKAKLLAAAKVDPAMQVRFVADLFQPDLIEESYGKGFYGKSGLEQVKLLAAKVSPEVDSSKFKRTAYDVLSAINRQPGADLESARGTLWGCFNAVTYYEDHQAGRDRDNALHAAWFGSKAALKSRALDRAVDLAQVL